MASSVNTLLSDCYLNYDVLHFTSAMNYYIFRFSVPDAISRASEQVCKMSLTQECAGGLIQCAWDF